MKNTIAFPKLFKFPPLLSDYLKNKPCAMRFYESSSIESMAQQLMMHPYQRTLLADILTQQNLRYKASQLTLANIQKFQHQNSLCVIAGQQPMLFGGPFFIILKIIALSKTADEHSKALGCPVIPIFWIAGEDHDFQEVNHTWMIDRAGEITKIQQAHTPNFPVSLSELSFDNIESLTTIKQQFHQNLGESEFTPWLKKLTEDSYALGRSFTDAFAIWLTEITRRYGVVFFNPSDASVKKLMIPCLKNIILSSKLVFAEKEINEKISSQGYQLQIKPNSSSSHLFYASRHGRKLILKNEKGYIVDGDIYSEGDMIKLIEQKPENFSGDVLARPILQSYLFPVIEQIVGPTEIAYIAQIKPLFELFDLIPPHYTLRPSATFIENRYQKLMEKYVITFKDLADDVELLINHIISQQLPFDSASDWHKLHQTIEKELDDFFESRLKFEPHCKIFARQVQGKILKSLKGLEHHVFSAQKKKFQVLRHQIYGMQHILMPNCLPQERVLNPSYFLLRYGPQFIDFIHKELALDPFSHQLIYLPAGGKI